MQTNHDARSAAKSDNQETRITRRTLLRGAAAVASAGTTGGTEGLASLVVPGAVGEALKTTEDLTELFNAASGLCTTTMSRGWDFCTRAVISRVDPGEGAESAVLRYVSEHVNAHFFRLHELRNVVGSLEQCPGGAKLIEELQRDGDALMEALRRDQGLPPDRAIACVESFEEYPMSSLGPLVSMVLPLDGPAMSFKLSSDSDSARLDKLLTAKYGRPSAYLSQAALVLRECLQPFGNRIALRSRLEGNFNAELPQIAHTGFLRLKEDVLQLFRRAAAPQGVWRSPAHQDAYHRLGDSLDITIQRLAEEVMQKHFPEYMAAESPHRQSVEKELARRKDRAVEKQRAAEAEGADILWPGFNAPGNDYY